MGNGQANIWPLCSRRSGVRGPNSHVRTCSPTSQLVVLILTIFAIRYTKRQVDKRPVQLAEDEEDAEDID